MCAPIVVNHLMATIVKTVITLKCSIDVAKLIIVKFEDNSKEYAFLLQPFIPVKIGMIIKDKRYTDPFEVMDIITEWTLPMYKDHVLKWITSDTLEWAKKPHKKENKLENKMEKRNIQISLEQAREWYHTGCEPLHELALSAFTEKELTEPANIEDIKKELGINELQIHIWSPNIVAARKVENMIKKEQINLELTIIAKFYNQDWVPKINEVKYFIGKNSPKQADVLCVKRIEDDFFIGKHISVMYPGLVYFKNAKDAEKAFNMLKKDLNELYK